MNPQAGHGKTLDNPALAHRFAFFPFALRVSGATTFFLASALPSPSDLAIRRRERHAMLPTDVCHPNEMR